MTLYQSDQFKTFYTRAQTFEFIRSKKGCQNIFQKRDLLGARTHQKRPHAIFQMFAVNHVFECLIDGFRSWECRNRHQMDLLYILIFARRSARRAFWADNKSYFEPESRLFGGVTSEILKPKGTLKKCALMHR